MAEEDENWRSDEHQHSHGFREQNSRDSSPKVAPCRKKLKTSNVHASDFTIYEIKNELTAIEVDKLDFSFIDKESLQEIFPKLEILNEDDVPEEKKKRGNFIS